MGLEIVPFTGISLKDRFNLFAVYDISTMSLYLPFAGLGAFYKCVIEEQGFKTIFSDKAPDYMSVLAHFCQANSKCIAIR